MCELLVKSGGPKGRTLLDKKYQVLLAELERLNCHFRIDEPMRLHTSFQIGGPADLFVEPSNIEQAAIILKTCRENRLSCVIIGNGTNLLVDDAGIAGVVICMSTNLCSVSLHEQTVIVQSGVPLSQLCLFAMEKGLTGLEFAYGIPGSVGGAVYMNAGAYGGEIKDVLTTVDAYDVNGEHHLIENEQAMMGYRSSKFQSGDWLIASAAFSLKPGNSDEIKARMQEIMNRRREKQPLEHPSAGSTFKRPQNGYASSLIDQCGLKGLRVGGAMVSEKHAGFIINTGCATSLDVLTLCDKIASVVKEKTGISLETEIKKL
jgi:UDP-N-acetylmuramate dehydrogenase